jgi:predicted secreted Zn-dependent protease
MRPAVLLAIAACSLSTAAPAQMHMCKDAQGRKVFSDVPCGPDAKLVTPTPAMGGPSIYPNANIQVEHYDIRGTSWEVLRQEIGSKGPEGWWGTAHTRIKYELKTRVTDEGCKVESVRASADAKVRLPMWRNRYEGTPDLQTYWDGAYRSLDLHERGHVQINLDGAKEMERALNAIPQRPTCGAIDAEARQRADAVRSEVSGRQISYDRETDHGRRQWSPYRENSR